MSFASSIESLQFASTYFNHTQYYRMTAQIYHPSPHLQSVIQRYELLEFNNKQPLQGSLIFFPSFINGLLFSFYKDQRPVLTNRQVSSKNIPSENLISSVTAPITISNISQIHCLRVIFHPGVLGRLFNKPMNKFTGKALPLSETLDKEFHLLWQNLNEIKEIAIQLKMIESFLLNRLSKFKNSNILYPVLNKELDTHGYSQSVAKIARSIGLGTRDLNRKLSAQLGIPMTKFINIHRFNKALKHIQQDPARSLSQIAYDLDYSDQPHFNREFKRLSGMTPSSYASGLRKGHLLLPQQNDDALTSGVLFKRA